MNVTASMDEIACEKYNEGARFMVRLSETDKEKCLVNAQLILKFITSGYSERKFTKALVQAVFDLNLIRNGFPGIPTPLLYSREYCYDHSFRKQQYRDAFVANIRQYVNINPLSAPCFTCWIMANVLEVLDATGKS